MKLSDLEEAIQRSWSRDTAQEPDTWTRTNPAEGQCAVTALVVQDYMQGSIVQSIARLPDNSSYSHYFNLLDGKEYDTTKSQFPRGTVIPPGFSRRRNFPSTRAYLLSNETTYRRYQVLKKRVAANLAYTKRGE